MQEISRRTPVLYISYDGILEPLGHSQVLRYLQGLSASRPIHLISFEKREDWADEDRRSSCATLANSAGIRWIPLPYRRSPRALSTVVNILAGLRAGIRVFREEKVGIVHARSYLPGLIALVLSKAFRAKFIFDMRGFWPDERVEAGAWARTSVAYVIMKRLERVLLTRADVIVSLTASGVEAMRGFPYLKGKAPVFAVIPTCTDLDAFRPALPLPAESKREMAPVFGFVGSVRLWYMFGEMARAFRLIRRRIPNASLVVLNRDEHPFVRESLRAAGVPESAYTLRSASIYEVPTIMREMDGGIFMIHPVFSKRASSPTKLGEFLASGVPCLTNSGVGDVDQVLAYRGAGVAIQSFAEKPFAASVDRFLTLLGEPGLKRRCRETAERFYSLPKGVEAYETIYRALEGPSGFANSPAPSLLK